MRRWYVVAAAAVLMGCSKSGPGGGVDAAIVNLMPPDTVVLGGVNVAQILKTRAYARLGESRGLPDELEEVARRTGLDAKRDLEEVYAASNGKQTLAIARLNIKDQAAVEKELESKGAKRIAMGSRTVFLAEGHAVSFLDGKVAVAGPVELVRAAVEGMKGDDSNRRAVLAKLSSLPRGSHAWAVSIGGVPFLPVPERGNLANLGRVFASLQAATLAVDLSDGVALAATGDCSDEKSAKQLHDTVRGLIAFGRLTTQKPELLGVIDKIEVAMNQTAVKVNAKAPLDVVETLINAR